MHALSKIHKHSPQLRFIQHSEAWVNVPGCLQDSKNVSGSRNLLSGGPLTTTITLGLAATSSVKKANVEEGDRTGNTAQPRKPGPSMANTHPLCVDLPHLHPFVLAES